MHEAAKMKPVVIDESLTDIEILMLAREMGYTGAALKACKGQSQALLHGRGGAEAQDVPVRAGSDVSRRLVHPFRRPGRARGVAAIEANSRQYVPSPTRAGTRSIRACSTSPMARSIMSPVSLAPA